MSKNYGIDMQGPFIGQRVATLPTWTAADEGREILTEDTNLRYYGTDTGWREYGAGGGGGSEFDMYADMLNSSVYLNCSWDGFINEDLIAGSTMTYNATENKFEFTVGEVIQSVDLYDSTLAITVTECMFYADFEDSGSPTIEVTADGGANWEVTTNGAIHTFANTGSDVRMKFTAGGSGEVRSWGIFYNADPTPQQVLNPVPPGGMIMFGGTVAPTGFLLCDGSSILVADYPDLFDAIGYTWGGGGPNFSLPDMAQRGPYGPGGGRSVGDTDGSETVDASHIHSISSDGMHNHQWYVGTAAPPFALSFDGVGSPIPFAGSGVAVPGVVTVVGGGTGFIWTADAWTDNEADHDHGGATGSGGSATLDVLDPIAVVNFIIKF